MRIFYQFGNQPLKPDAGDQINELQLCKSMKRVGTIVPKDADIYYVRANAKLFLSLPSPKIWFASPYNTRCFNQADAIATFSDEWTRRLRLRVPTGGSKRERLKYVFTVNQPVDPAFKPMKNHARTQAIRKKMGGEFIIGHFGTMRFNRVPTTLMKLLPSLKKDYPQLNVVFSDTTGFNTKGLIKQMSFPYTDMPYVLNACDMLIFTTCPRVGVNGNNGKDPSGNFSGLLRSKEGMMCGVPHILPSWPARVEEFGPKYEFYHDYVPCKDGLYPPRIRHQIRDLIVKGIEDDSLRKRVGKRLVNRARARYTVGACARKLDQDFRRVIDAT